jgi:hypothetical protein
MGGTTYAIDSGLDLDSHADMAVLGSNCIVLEETGRTIDVFSYDPKLGSTERKVVSGTFAYDDPDTGRVVLLIVHQGLHIPHLTYSLIPPFQMRENGVEVNETPKFQCSNPRREDHAVIIAQGDDQPYRIPLSLHGTSSFIHVRRPTKTEINDVELARFELTSATPDWEPGSTRFSEIEQQLESQSPVGDGMTSARTASSAVRSSKAVKEAFSIDKENGDHRWAESIQKEMNNVRVAFRILEDGEEVPPTYQFMKCHLVFDIKFDGFRFKSRMVAGGHMIDTPPFLTYASVVSRETVRIALLMASLHDLEGIPYRSNVGEGMDDLWP